MPHYALSRGNCPQFFNVHDTKPLYVDWPAQLVSLVIAVWVHLLHGVELIVLVCLNDVFYLLLFSPLDEVLPHDLHGRQIEFSSPTETQQIVIVEVHHAEVADAGDCDPFLELSKNLVLLWGSVTHKTRVLSLLRLGAEHAHHDGKETVLN